MRAMMDLKIVPWPPGSSSRMPAQLGRRLAPGSSHARASDEGSDRVPSPAWLTRRTPANKPDKEVSAPQTPQPPGRCGASAPLAGAAPALQHHGGVDHLMQQHHLEVASGAQLQGRRGASRGDTAGDGGWAGLGLGSDTAARVPPALHCRVGGAKPLPDSGVVGVP